MVHDIAPAGTPIQDLIEKWYPGALGAAGTAPVKPAVPSGWSSQVNAYHNVYGRSCRTCHVARDNGSPSNYITFYSSSTAADDYAGTSFVVCGLPKVMPNAFVTYKNFWSDLQRVIDYRSLAGVTPATCQ
jgi:mono/diheme cytochrome c family protein